MYGCWTCESKSWVQSQPLQCRSRRCFCYLAVQFSIGVSWEVNRDTVRNIGLLSVVLQLRLVPGRIGDQRPLVSLQSASGRFRFLVPPSGTTCLSTSHLRRHSRFSDNDSRPFCFITFVPRHYHMTRVLLLPFTTTVWTPVVLGIINIV